MKTALYKADKTGISVFQIEKQMAEWKHAPETEWLAEVNSQALQQSLKHLDAGFTRFFKKTAQYPKFKSKGNRDGFCNPQSTKVKGTRLYIPKFKGGIKAVFHRPLAPGKIKSSTVSRTSSGKYFVSILVETQDAPPTPKLASENKTLGIDLGLTRYLTDSNGQKTENPRHLKKRLRKLRRLGRVHSRKKKGSKNRNKSRVRLARAYERVTNSRNDFLHKLTNTLAKNQGHDSIAMEDLDVAGMLVKGKKTKLSRHIADAGWGTFRQMLTYKCEREGKNLLFIGRFEPSSKLCTCGFLASLTLADRVWTCLQCNETHDRDILAAQNIKRFAFCEQNTGKSVLPAKKIASANKLSARHKPSIPLEWRKSTLGELGNSLTLNQEASVAF